MFPFSRFTHVCPLLQEAAAATFQEEFEEDEATRQQQASALVNAQLLLGSSDATQEVGGLQLRVQPQQGGAGGAKGRAAAAAAGAASGGLPPPPKNVVAAAAAAQLIREFSSSAGAGRAAGTHFGDGGEQAAGGKVRGRGCVGRPGTKGGVFFHRCLWLPVTGWHSLLTLCPPSALMHTGGGCQEPRGSTRRGYGG